MRLDINLYMDRSCRFTAVDQTVFHESEVTNVEKHVFVEFMCYVPYSDSDNLVALDRSKKVTTFTDESNVEIIDRVYNYTFAQDGRHRYYKYGLYTIDHPGIYDGVTYNIQNKVFYHEGVIYFGLQNTTTPEFNSTNSRTIVNWYQLINYTAFAIDFWFDKEIFTICNLEKCLVALQKELIFSGLRGCNYNNCQKDANTKAQRDFLFASSYVLGYLINIGNYEEAQRIIESLSTCGGLCDGKLLTNNKCNCN